MSRGFFVRWLFCPIGRFKPIKLIAWKIRGEKLKSSYFSPRCFPVLDMIGSSRPISEKKSPCKKSSRLLSPSGEMPLMMNTNSKILPSQDSNLSCYSPSTLTFSAPAFYLSSFMILVGRRFPFPKNTELPSTNCPWKIAPIKIAPRVGIRQFTGGIFPRSNSPSFSQREAAFQG